MTPEPERSPLFQEVVLCCDETSRKAHRDLFNLDASCYRELGDRPLDAVEHAVTAQSARLHIVATWECILRIAAWRPATPSWFEVFTMLKKAGLSDADLAPFARSDINDLFPWLYYANRLDVLRKVCNQAKKKIESLLSGRRLQVHCHMVSREEGRIVASSL